ncbi:MAG: hypothetical protein E7001_00895 [Coriobacteriaceae bacterium]|nr:hypothetical protein [Coriobacteriaceae bacterium]
MDAVMSALNWYAALPSSVMILISIFLVGLLLARLKIGEALKCAIYMAAALVGMSALVGMFMGVAVPVLTQVVENFGLHFDVVDFGIAGAYSNVLFPLSFYSILLVVGFAVNILMIVTKLTDTFDADIFNYSVWALAACFVYAITGNIALAIGAFVVNEVIVLKLADITAPTIQEAYGLEGVSIPHGNAIIFAPVGMAVNWAIERIPVLAKIDWSPESIEERFGGLVQPSTIGFAMGIVLGVVGQQGFGQTMYIAITFAAFMIAFPRIENILVEGITPIADGMRETCEKRFGRTFHIGLDAAILVGMPDVMATGILLTPAMLLLAFVLPGNRVLPLADVAIAAPFLISCVMPYCKKNIFRGFIAGLIVLTITLYVCSMTAEWYSAAAAVNGLPFDSLGTSVGIGSSWPAAAMGWLASLFG